LWPIGSLRSRVDDLEPGDGFVRLLTAFAGLDLDQVLWRVSREEAPAFVA